MQKQKELIERFNSSVLSLSINIPGNNKLSKDAKIIFDVAMDEISKLNLKTLQTCIVIRASGYEAQIALDENAVRVKKRVVQIEENHPLGRFMDIDIIDDKKKQISRSDICMAQRRCFLCENDAKICARSRKHPLEELLFYIHMKVQKYETTGHSCCAVVS